jgi:hypothetical protein
MSIQEQLQERRFDPTFAPTLEAYVDEQVIAFFPFMLDSCVREVQCGYKYFDSSHCVESICVHLCLHFCLELFFSLGVLPTHLILSRISSLTCTRSVRMTCIDISLGSSKD